ncbi:copper transporter 6-like [Alnus glutinosa]|uniref:copper transporter 6-like n=1 Tax=Alnus glutinosa TaxID=3517 RepID=UPI002D7A2AE4|nr:copper transporter 6-like [Alnus glutinosa]
MDGMDHGGMHGMGGMSPPTSTMNGTTGMMMHMTFFWGTNAEILFSHWPAGKSTGMYVLALFFIFALSFLVEFLSHCRLVKPGSSDMAAGLVQTFLFAVRIGLAYMVMLAVMSFNGGVFLVAVAGHTLGFFFFGSRIFKKPEAVKGSDLPPLTCC